MPSLRVLTSDMFGTILSRVSLAAVSCTTDSAAVYYTSKGARESAQQSNAKGREE